MTTDENILVYISRVSHVAPLLRSMGVTVGDSEIAMAVLNKLSDCFGYVITARGAFREEKYSIDLVKSRLLQKEHRSITRSFGNESALFYISTNFAIRQKAKCGFCGRTSNRDERCYKTFSRLQPTPPSYTKVRQAALLNTTENQADQEHDVVCLIANNTLSLTTASVCLAVSPPQTSELTRFLDSGASADMNFRKDVFLNYVAQDPTPVQVGHGPTVQIHGRGDVNLDL